MCKLVMLVGPGEGRGGGAVILQWLSTHLGWSRNASTPGHFMQLNLETKGAGGRFSKAPETFRARKAIAKSRTLRVQSCFIHIF